MLMAAADNDKPAKRAIRAVSSVNWGAKAKKIAASLKAQHAAGRDGDDSPAEPVWPTPKEQLEALKVEWPPPKFDVEEQRQQLLAAE